MAGETNKTAQQHPRRASAPPLEFLTLTVRCPVCNTEFTSEIPNPGAPVGRETDLRPLFAGLDPLPSLIQSCPSCRYTAYQSGYDGGLEEVEELIESLAQRPGDRAASRLPRLEENELDELRRWIRRGMLAQGIAEGREPFGAERYLLAARCHEYVEDDDPLVLADYYLRAAWCARASGLTSLERECQREAVVRFEAALEDATLITESDKPRLLYLIGELSRRGGDFAKAVDFFTQLESAHENLDADDLEAVLFEQLAKRMLALAVVKSDVNAGLPEEELELERDDEYEFEEDEE